MATKLDEHSEKVAARIAGLAARLDKNESIGPQPLHDACMLFLVTGLRSVLPSALLERTAERVEQALSEEQRDVVKVVRRRRSPTGRPRTVAELLRTKSLVVRLSEQEADAILTRAQDVSSSRASFVRNAALGLLPVRVPPLNLDAARQLAGVANNLNQAVKALHSAALVEASENSMRILFEELRDECRVFALQLQGVTLTPEITPGETV